MKYWQARVGKTLYYQYLIKTYTMISGLDRPIYYFIKDFWKSPYHIWVTIGTSLSIIFAVITTTK